MSEKPNPYLSGAYAAYMASTFSSAARLCAHEADFIAARIRVLQAVGIATSQDASSARTLARNARSQERKAGEAYERSHEASRRGLPRNVVASHTSSALRHSEVAHGLEDRARNLELAIIGRGKSTQSPCLNTTPLIRIWSVPVQGRARVASIFGSAVSPALGQWIATWTRAVKARDQLLICVSSHGRRMVQVARPALHTEIWPWTVRVLPDQLSRADRDELPQSLVSFLIKKRFVSHFDRGLWCHVAPAEADEFGKWLVGILAAVAVGKDATAMTCRTRKRD